MHFVLNFQIQMLPTNFSFIYDLCYVFVNNCEERNEKNFPNSKIALLGLII